MTVIRPNSVSGITSITAQANEINFFRSNGALAGLQLNGVNFNTTTGVSTFNNLDVGGVLTYQDVTNVDSLGIGTFRTGINVSGGQLDVGSNIKLGNAGVITATSFSGSGANLTSLPTQVTLSNNADNRIITGGSGVNLNGEANLTFNGTTLDLNGTANILKSDSSGFHVLIRNTNNTNGNQAELRFQGTNSSNGGYTTARIIATNLDNYNQYSDLRFFTHSLGSTTEKLRITSGGKLTLSNSEGIQLSAKTSTLYTSDGSISYYATNNAVYINGAGASGWMRLSAAGTANNRTAINIYGHSHASADQIDFRTNSTERLRIDSSGISKFMNFGGGQIHLGGGSAHSAKVTVTDNAGTGNGNFLFAGPSGEHLRITSGGNIGINNTSPAYKLDVAASGTVVSRFKQNTNSTAQTASCVLIRHAAALSGQDGVGMLFQNSGGSHVGRIDLGQSTTNYRTSSDYRLKENAVPISDGISRLKTLKPYRFNWIAEKDQPKVDGFFAHEVTAVPESISGAKDEIDSDNNPVYQSMDHSKLVPLLTAALQEAITEIETLKTKVAALEGS